VSCSVSKLSALRRSSFRSFVLSSFRTLFRRPILLSSSSSFLGFPVSWWSSSRLVSSSFRPFRVHSSSCPLVLLSITRARCFVALQSVCCSFLVSSSPDRFRALSVSLSARPAYANSSAVGHPSIRSSCKVPASRQNPSGSESTALSAPFAPVVFLLFRCLTAPSLGCVSRRGVLVHSWSLVL
jgi:hypothetical protein